MSGRVVSFAWGRGLGHVSRLIAVHTALRALGWESLLLTDREQRLTEDHGFAQVVIPTDATSLVGEPLYGTGPSVDHRLARALVDQALAAGDVVLHDVTVQRELYDRAVRLGCRQVLVHRFQRNRPDPAAWVARHTPAIGQVCLLGEPDREETAHGVRLTGIPHVVRQLLGTRSPWPPGIGEPRIAVVAGGGGHADAPAFLDAALDAVRSYGARAAGAGHGPWPADLLVLTGPNFRGRVTVPPGLPGPVRVTPYLGPDYDVYRHATVAITHGGYNTVQELARSGVPAVVVPGVRDFDDQRVHLRAAAARLNATVVEPDPDAIAQALHLLLRSGRRPLPSAPPEPDGAAVLARALVLPQEAGQRHSRSEGA
ncbi:glycosyltransferase [Streptomyces sp. NPDC091377]|uniref:glycosyltransferase n=1 Tax=Streptomyces sp. NPDC091377 TaxID=3365995 RepID=UPI0038060FB8